MLKDALTDPLQGTDIYHPLLLSHTVRNKYRIWDCPCRIYFARFESIAQSFRQGSVLYEAGVDWLIEMKIVGHTDYKTTANIYTHVRDEMLKKATVNMGEVFGFREKG